MANVDIVVTSRNQAGPGLTQAAGQVDRLGRSASQQSGKLGGLGSAAGALGGALKAGLVGAAAVAGAALLKLGVDSIKSGSDLQQSLGAAEAVFGRNVGAIKTAAEGAAASVGLSRAEYLQLAATLGAGLKNQGLKDFGSQTQGVIKLGADLAAQFGGSTQDAIAAIGSLMRGEADPIEKYGISIKQSAINAELAAKGQSKLTGAARTQADAQARLTLLMKQAGSAQGAFARESNTLAGQQQRLSANFENVKATIGTALLPTLGALVGGLNQAVTGTGQIGAAVSAAGAVLSSIFKPAIDQIVPAVQMVSGALLQAAGGSEGLSQTLAVLGPIVAQGAALLGQYFAGAIRGTAILLTGIITVVGRLGAAFRAGMTTVVNFGRAIAASPTGQAIWTAIKGGVDLVKAGGDLARSAISLLGSAISGVGQGVFHLISPAIDKITSAAGLAKAPLDAIGSAISGVGSGILDSISSTLTNIGNAASSAAGFIRGLADALGRISLGGLAQAAGLTRAGGGGMLTTPDVGRRITIHNQWTPPPIVIDGRAFRGIVRAEVRAAMPSGGLA